MAHIREVEPVVKEMGEQEDISLSRVLSIDLGRLNVPADAHDPAAVGLGGVEQDHKGLPQSLELGNDPLLRLQVG